jgi:isochorismate synthase
MKIVRRQVENIEPSTLRALGARNGWLLESPDVLRCGFGRSLRHIIIDKGLASTVAASRHFEDFELVGDEGPAGTGVVGFTAIPFDRHRRFTIDVPEYLVNRYPDGTTWLSSSQESDDFKNIVDMSIPSQQPLLDVGNVQYEPSPEGYAQMVAKAVEMLRHHEIEKVVLARSVRGVATETIDPAAIVQRLQKREPTCTLYALPSGDGGRFLGASPELLLRVTRNEVTLRPLAGTIALPDENSFKDYETWLLGSTKNLIEHQIVVDYITEQLGSVCLDVTASQQPSIVTLGTLAHLGTWIRAQRDSQIGSNSALALLSLLHPTPAVGGFPKEKALEVMRQLEPGNRGLYAGAVGWLDAYDNSEWWVGIRSLLIHERNFEAWAGAGIVADSDPVAEREETRNKLMTALGALTTSI